MLEMLDNKIPSPTEPATEPADGERLLSKDPVIVPTGETLQVPEAVDAETAAGEILESSPAKDNAAEEIPKVSEVSDIAAGETLQVTEPPDTGSMAAEAVLPACNC